MDVGIRDLKARLSEYLARVERGEVIGITSRGRRIAEIVPALGVDSVERGVEEGWITFVRDEPPAAVVRVPPRSGTRSTTELIRADRDA
jgi:prevent-host-death family protein